MLLSNMLYLMVLLTPLVIDSIVVELTKSVEVDIKFCGGEKWKRVPVSEFGAELENVECVWFCIFYLTQSEERVVFDTALPQILTGLLLIECEVVRCLNTLLRITSKISENIAAQYATSYSLAAPLQLTYDMSHK